MPDRPTSDRQPRTRRRPRSNTPEAVRKRRFRDLRARGASMLMVEIGDLDGLVIALLNASDAAIRAGAAPRLTEAESYDRDRIAAAAGEILREWQREWQRR